MKSVPLAAAVGALASASLAHADTVDLRFVGIGLGRNVQIVVGSASEQVFAGEILHEFGNGTGRGASLGGTHVTFCTDLFQYVSGDWTTFTLTDIADMPTPPIGEAKAQAVADLYAAQASGEFRGVVDGDAAAAFQMAIWEVITDFNPSGGRASLDVSSGDFRAMDPGGTPLSAPILDDLDHLFGAIGSGKGRQSLIGLANRKTQDQIIEFPPSIPLPGVAGLTAAGLAGLLIPRRRVRG